jgi:hypothetical protein
MTVDELSRLLEAYHRETEIRVRLESNPLVDYPIVGTAAGPTSRPRFPVAWVIAGAEMPRDEKTGKTRKTKRSP